MNKPLAALLSALFGGCAIGPDYRQPQLPEQESFYSSQTVSSDAASAREAFWRGFQDPQLLQ